MVAALLGQVVSPAEQIEEGPDQLLLGGGLVDGVEVGGILDKGVRFGAEGVEVCGLGQGFLPGVGVEDAIFEKVVGEQLTGHCEWLVGSGRRRCGWRLFADWLFGLGGGNCRTCGLILPVEWGWRSGQTHLNWDATIAGRHNSPDGGAGRTPFLSAKGREGARRTPFFVHGGPRRTTKKTLFCPRRGAKKTFFCPRRAKNTFFCPEGARRGAKGQDHENTFFVREGARRKPFFVHGGPRRGTKNTFFVREGARRKPFFVHEGARRGRENRAIASKFGRHNSPRRAPTRGAPTDVMPWEGRPRGLPLPIQGASRGFVPI